MKDGRDRAGLYSLQRSAFMKDDLRPVGVSEVERRGDPVQAGGELLPTLGSGVPVA